MIKFTATGAAGEIVVGLGLEPENITLMQAGHPLHVSLRDLGFTGALGAVHVVVFTGKDADSMRRDLSPMVGPDTVTHIEPRKGR